MKRSAAVLVSGLIAGVVFAGCSPAVTGGDTTCKDFSAADQNTQSEAVAKMLKDEKGHNAATMEVTGTRLSVLAFCQTIGTQDSKIKEAPHL
jgi:acid stress chaperone HdeA